MNIKLNLGFAFDFKFIIDQFFLELAGELKVVMVYLMTIPFWEVVIIILAYYLLNLKDIIIDPNPIQ